jgi:hypothetical protein
VLLRQACARFGGAHLALQPRVARTLLKALLDLGKPLATHYGAQEWAGGF